MIPFSWLPASWGLKGKAYDVAEAHYKFTGYELEKRLIELNLEDKERDLAFVDLKIKYDRITLTDADRERIIIKFDGEEQEVELLMLDLREGLIDKHEGEKKVADLLKEPWVAVISDGLDMTAGPNGFYFEFDWNEHWILMLKGHGYAGRTDEDIMERWFRDVCLNEVSDNINMDTPKMINRL